MIDARLPPALSPHFLSNHSYCRRGRPPLAAPHRGAARRPPGLGRAGRRRAPPQATRGPSPPGGRGGRRDTTTPPRRPGVAGPFPARRGARRVCRFPRPARSALKRNPPVGLGDAALRCRVGSAPRLLPGDLVIVVVVAAAAAARRSLPVLWWTSPVWRPRSEAGCGSPRGEGAASVVMLLGQRAAGSLPFLKLQPPSVEGTLSLPRAPLLRGRLPR